MNEHERIYRRAVIKLRDGHAAEAAKLALLAYEKATGRYAEDSAETGA